jgi:hypothetical protein
MKPLKSDFKNFVPFNMNIADDKINPYINDAFKFDIRPKLEGLADDILAYSGTDRPQLKTFYDNYILHWWVLLAYKRFLEIHGLNVTQFGITKTKDPGGTFEQLSRDDRAIILKQYKSDAATLEQLVYSLDWKFDNVQYRKSTDCKGPISDFGINAIP